MEHGTLITDGTSVFKVCDKRLADGVPVGFEFISNTGVTPAGCLPLRGNLYSRSTYKPLWDYVNANPSILLTESEWQTKYNENPNYVPFYSQGTSSSNFRVPIINDLDINGSDFVVDSGIQNSIWYRKWKSGWLEMGGTLSPYTPYVTKTISFPFSFKDTTYHFDFQQGYTGDLYASVVSAKTVSSATVVNTSNTSSTASWEARGYMSSPPSLKSYLWCVKAHGYIDASNSSTSLSNISKNITDLNTKVDACINNNVNTQSTIITEVSSFVNHDFDKVLLYSNLGNSSKWDGNIYFSQSFRNFDYLQIEFSSSYALSGEAYLTLPLSVKMISDALQDRIDSNFTNYLFPIWFSYASWHWSFDTRYSTDTYWQRYAHSGAYPRRVWGLKLKSTGVTNKSAVDVSQIEEKISSLISSDNHLILPSGLEVW